MDVQKKSIIKETRSFTIVKKNVFIISFTFSDDLLPNEILFFHYCFVMNGNDYLSRLVTYFLIVIKTMINTNDIIGWTITTRMKWSSSGKCLDILKCADARFSNDIHFFNWIKVKLKDFTYTFTCHNQRIMNKITDFIYRTYKWLLFNSNLIDSIKRLQCGGFKQKMLWINFFLVK